MRPGVSGLFAALCLIASAGSTMSTAHAEPRLEASGFIGFDYFGDRTELGNSPQPEQIPHTAPMLGARLTIIVLPSLGAAPIQVLLEGEAALAASETGSTPPGPGGRMSYFAPVFGWRGHVTARVTASQDVQPFVLFGVGGETVASSSPYMHKETDAVVYYGPGLVVPIAGTWHMRLDLRHGFMPGRDHSVAQTFEAQLGITTTFGFARKRRPAPIPEPPPAQPIVDEKDTDGDGLPDHLDRCPTEKETVNGIDDGDGCPEADPDGDGVLGAADQCPMQPEDADHFQDEDGCPDLDNDGDGIDDAHDKCPNEPETRNGFDDDDGCPDALPAEIVKTLTGTAKITFELNRARVTDPAKKALAPVFAVLRDHPAMRVRVVGHPLKAGGEDLAKRRAEAVKWHLVDLGIPEDRIDTGLGMVARAPAIEIVAAPTAPAITPASPPPPAK